MEKIIKELNDKIREIAQSEEIDTQKLTELINIRDGLKSYSTSNISQIQHFNVGNNNVLPATLPPLIMHRNNGLYDGIVDVAEKFLKVQSDKIENKGNINIHDLIFYHKFVSELQSEWKRDDSERIKIKEGIEQLIIKELKNIITKENNTEKDKIIETTSEIKNIEKPLSLEVQT